MSKYVLAYRGGGMGETAEEQEAAMTQWMNWFGALGDSVVDAGSPFGPAATIESSGSVNAGGSSALSGYSIITAENIDDACDKAKGCPVLSSGGSLEVYEALSMG